MPSFKSAFGNYIKFEDLRGKEIRVIIGDVKIEDVKDGDKNEKKLVATFVGKDKGLILNRTNAESIAEIAGTDDYEKWPGTAVILHGDKTTFGGKKVDCLRIRGVQSHPAAAPPPPPPSAQETITEDDIPF